MNVLPCPFCGSTNVTVQEGSTFRWRKVVCVECEASAGEIRCQTLGDGNREQWEKQAHADAIAAWNERTPSTPAT